MNISLGRLGWLILGITAIATGQGRSQERRATLGFEETPTNPPKVVRGASPTDDFVFQENKHDRVEGVLPKALVDPKAFDIAEADDAPPFRGRLTLRGDAGDGVGYRRGFVYGEGMIPVRQSQDDLLFADVRIVNFVEENRWEYNLGGGYRWFCPVCEQVFGVNGFYDARKTDFHYYSQIGLGVEALTPNWEFRSNGYIIVGPAHRLVGDTGRNNQGIVGNNFVFAQQQQVEFAYTGLDAEFGVRLPWFERILPRVYVGAYSYFADGETTTYGARGRLEVQLGRRVTAHFQVQNDKVFDTTVTGGLAISFGAAAYREASRGAPSWNDVIRQRVHRDVNIVINQTTTTTVTTEPVPPPPPPPAPPPSESEGRGD